MIRPLLAFVLWLCIAVLVLANNLVGDTWIALALTQSAVEWYKVLVPAPYVVMMAAIHARRTRGPEWLTAALVAAALWTPSTVIVDFLYARLTFGEEPASFLDRFAFWWGAPYGLLALTLFVSPLVMGKVFAVLAPPHSDGKASRP